MTSAPACTTVDPEIFFDPARTQQALDICATCPFAKQCREKAENEEHGVWGGRVHVTMRIMGGRRTVTHKLVAWPTDPVHVDVLTRLREDQTPVEVAESTDLTVQRIESIIKRYKDDGQATAEVHGWVLEMRKNGARTTTIAEQLDLSVRQVNRIIKQAAA